MASRTSLGDTAGYTMFVSRWLQAPLYLGLIVAQGVYVWQFMVDLFHLFANVGDTVQSEKLVMLGVLGLIDVVMISNLLIMVIVGGFETFVSRIRRIDEHPDRPEWLSHVNANVLKVKLAMAIIGISSIHLLQTFINAGGNPVIGERPTAEQMMWQTIMHLAFVVSAIALAVIDRIMGGATENHPGRYGGTPAARGHAEVPHARTPDRDAQALDGQALR
jgi:uncharacterized protein (TIGR00645 family)